MVRANSGVTMNSKFPNIERAGRQFEQTQNNENIYGTDFKSSSDANVQSKLSAINSKSISYIDKDEGEFGKMPNSYHKKQSNNLSDFQQRFQDKQSFMNKEGHIGIVNNAQQPIIKKIDRIDLN